MPISRTQTARALIYNIVANEKEATAVNPAELTVDGSPVAGEAKGLDTALAIVIAQYEANETRLQPHALRDTFKADVPKILSAPYRALQQKTIATAQNNDAADARLLDRPNDPASIARRAALRAALPADLQARATALASSDLDTLFAFLEMPADAPERLISSAKDRAMLLSHIRNTGMQANYQRQPTAADPTAFGPDEGAALQAAEKARAWRDTQREAVTLARTTLGQIIDVVSVAADVDRDTAFALLTAGDA